MFNSATPIDVVEFIGIFIGLLGSIGSMVLWMARREFLPLKDFNSAMKGIRQQLDDQKEHVGIRMNHFELELQGLKNILQNQPTIRDTKAIEDKLGNQAVEVGKMSVALLNQDKLLTSIDQRLNNIVR